MGYLLSQEVAPASVSTWMIGVLIITTCCVTFNFVSAVARLRLRVLFFADTSQLRNIVTKAHSSVNHEFEFH